MLTSIRSALLLLDLRSRRILLLLVIIQVLLAFMDLAGVLLVGLVAALSAASLSGESPAFVAQVERFFSPLNFNDVTLVVFLACLAGVILIAKSVLGFLLIRRSLKFLANRQAMVSSSLAERLLSLPLLDVYRQSSQERAYALTAGVNSATIGVLGNAVVLVSESAVLLALAGGLFFLDPMVAVFAIVFFAAVGVTLNRALGNWARRLGRRVSAAEVASHTAVQDAVRTYREMTVSGRRSFLITRFQGLRWEAARMQADSQIMNQVSKYVFEVALLVGAAALAFSQALTQDLIAAVAVIAVFFAAASRIMPAMLRLQQASLGLKTSAGTAEITFSLSEELGSSTSYVPQIPPPPDLGGQGEPPFSYEGFRGSLMLKEVFLTYPDTTRPAVDAISLTLDPGESLAIVGPTGAGKSSLADLILGVVEPNLGSILISGVNPGAAVKRWPGAIAYVPQDVSIVNGSVRDNVALGLPVGQVADELIWEALLRAHLAEMLQSERAGLDTVVGESGVRLSGGQRQRLGLARALYTRPRLLVLDEATSALDAETERAVSDAVNGMAGEVTLVIIAHRLATIRNATRVAYMESGRLLALGTFDDVRKAQPRFDRQAALLGL